MGSSETTPKPTQLLEEVLNFVEGAAGLDSAVTESGVITIQQNIDGKLFRFKCDDLNDVLQRVDGDGKQFIQVNFQNGNKVLFTDTLVGFKPRETIGLDMGKIPRVVTTPDLVSVFEAIEDSMGSDMTPANEVEVLKKVFQAILQGGELAGFDLSFERRWLARLSSTNFKASA